MALRLKNGFHMQLFQNSKDSGTGMAPPVVAPIEDENGVIATSLVNKGGTGISVVNDDVALTSTITNDDNAATGLNTTHRGSAGGGDHSDVSTNNGKITNVTTDLSLGTKAPTTMDVNSSDGTNATLVEADTTNAGLLGAAKWNEIVANTSHKGSAGTDHSDVGLANTHRGLSNNPHSVNKTDVALGNVANTAQVTAVTGGTGITSSGGTTPAISLTNKTSYWSCPGLAFGGQEVFPNANGYFENDGAGIIDVFKSVELPHGAIVTNVIVSASDTGDTWYLRRYSLTNASGDTDMATAAMGTADSTITTATIDNSSYGYYLYAELSDPTNVYGAKITYTTDYI